MAMNHKVFTSEMIVLNFHRCIREQPHRAPGLIGCQILMLKASNEYEGKCCLAYNRHIRQQAAFQLNPQVILVRNPL